MRVKYPYIFFSTYNSVLWFYTNPIFRGNKSLTKLGVSILTSFIKKLPSVNFFLQHCFDNSDKLYFCIWSVLLEQINLCWGVLVVLPILFFLGWLQSILKQVIEVGSAAGWYPKWNLAWFPQPWWFFSHLMFLELGSINLRRHQFIFLLRLGIGLLNHLVVSLEFQVKLNILWF